MIVVASRDVATPAAFAAVSLVALLSGASIRLRSALVAASMVVMISLWTAVFFALVAQTDLGSRTPEKAVGFLKIHMDAWEVGLATSVRMLAIIVLTLLGAIETKAEELTASLVEHCHIPYRFAYGAATAHRFISAYRSEMAVLLAAQRARGNVAELGPLGYFRRARRYIVPLLVSGARHASKLSLSMDARGFGAYPRRTFRNKPVIDHLDILYLLVAWAIVIAIAVDPIHAPFFW